VIETLASDQNPRFQRWRRIAASARDRREAGLIWLEGSRLVEEGLAAVARSGWADDPEATLLLDARQPAACAAVQARAAELGLGRLAMASLAPVLWARLSQVEQPQGVALVMRTPCAPLGLAEALQGAGPWQDWVVLDGLQDPGNLGNLLRAAMGGGVSGAVLLKGTAEAYSPKALRAGMGAQFHLPVWEGVSRTDLQAMMRHHAIQGVLTLAPHVRETLPLWAAAPLGSPTSLAWILGQEGAGLDPSWDSQRDALRVTIPQAAGLESLNVTTAAAVCFFERSRLRWAAAQASGAAPGGPAG